MKYLLISMGFTLVSLMGPLFADEAQSLQQTLSIIKPEAVANNQIGKIISRFEKAGLKMVAGKMTKLSKQQAQAFYAVHKDRPFYNSLVTYMSSGPVFVQVLEGPDAVAKNREIMGPTDPQKAAPGTIRADFGASIEKNAVHGSDSLESAKTEIQFFFSPSEIYSRANN